MINYLKANFNLNGIFNFKLKMFFNLNCPKIMLSWSERT